MNFARWTCLLLLAAGAAAETAPKLETVVQAVESEVRPSEAMERMYRVYSTDRWFSFPKFQETAEYLMSAMQEAGLSPVEMVSPPADGVTQYGYWTMPLAWDVRTATLELVEPVSPAALRVLADYRKVPASVGMWSGPTPPGGIVAEVAELRTLDPAEIEKADLKGKFVLVRQSTYAQKLPLVKKGAIGVINGYTENPVLRDGHYWVNFWGDSGWGFTKKSTPLPSFSITPRSADRLSEILARGQTVRVKATVNSRLYAGSYPYVTGVVRGSGSDEEVLELGHTTEVGANDNATGVAVMVEAVAALNRLINSGKLPRPRRSIRILAMPEVYGTMHYLATNPDRVRRTVAAICLDTPAGPYDAAGTEYTFMLNPDVARSYSDALILRVAQAYYPGLGNRRRWHWAPNMTGTDTFLSDPTVGIPTVWGYGGPGVNTHHNSQDTPDQVDPRSMRDITTVAAAFLYTVAAAGDAEVPWLAAITATRGYENITRAAAPAREGIERAATASELSRMLDRGLQQVAYCADRDEEAILSALRLANPESRDKLRRALADEIARLRKFAEEQRGGLSKAAERRAGELGVQGGLPAPPVDPRLADAAKIVVKRNRIGPVTLDDLPTDQWEGYPSAAWDGMIQTALNWCDGRRNLAEVIRLTGMEHHIGSFDFTGYFRFLAKHGYVELVGVRN